MIPDHLGSIIATEDFLPLAPPLRKASKRDRSEQLVDVSTGGSHHLDIAIRIFADWNDTRERGQVWTVEGWQTCDCVILSPGCVCAVQRQRYEQEGDKSIHDYRQGDDTQMIDRQADTPGSWLGVSTATSGKLMCNAHTRQVFQFTAFTLTSFLFTTPFLCSIIFLSTNTAHTDETQLILLPPAASLLETTNNRRSQSGDSSRVRQIWPTTSKSVNNPPPPIQTTY